MKCTRSEAEELMEGLRLFSMSVGLFCCVSSSSVSYFRFYISVVSSDICLTLTFVIYYDNL